MHGIDYHFCGAEGQPVAVDDIIELHNCEFFQRQSEQTVSDDLLQSNSAGLELFWEKFSET